MFINIFYFNLIDLSLLNILSAFYFFFLLKQNAIFIGASVLFCYLFMSKTIFLHVSILNINVMIDVYRKSNKINALICQI